MAEKQAWKPQNKVSLTAEAERFRFCGIPPMQRSAFQTHPAP